MWPSRAAEKQRIATALLHHAATVRALPGLADPQALDVLAMQFVASLRREDYYRAVQRKPVSARRANPNNPSFDPERAVAYYVQQQDLDEAAWLVFLMTHFARPTDTGWLRLQDVYGRLGAGIWNWATVSGNPAAFTRWLADNGQKIRGKFGNHRKYESLRPDANRNIGLVVASYIGWIGNGGHGRFFANSIRRAGNDPHVIFDVLYQEMPVVSFGRLAKFDYLALIGRYRIAPIGAGSAYLDGATGPAKGARLLFDGRTDSPTPTNDLQGMLDALDNDLQVGMQVMEDALCNWQKSPLAFVHFKG
ncbi:hypothetical protein [Mesorhizobium muleiense]|uniref:alpha-glutamyl/putrescinyl thymine pyrophosphorylase clade 3 protein n=1 Tax=Mesorhizobium muleiense TaxID=1004279 RepID=UPI001F386DA7|nr:hypothetical protein [Mesorhizobium muleiense]MCF6113411.1 hypothetical protein [Mesorhizobium muleiense]